MNVDPLSDDGFRNNLALSRAARGVFGLRHMDVDLYQLCKYCRRPELFIESTSKVGFKNTRDLRVLGTICGSPTLLVKHVFNDVLHEHPIDMFLWEPGRTGRDDLPDEELRNGSWGNLQSYLLLASERHSC